MIIQRNCFCTCRLMTSWSWLDPIKADRIQQDGEGTGYRQVIKRSNRRPRSLKTPFKIYFAQQVTRRQLCIRPFAKPASKPWLILVNRWVIPSSYHIYIFFLWHCPFQDDIKIMDAMSLLSQCVFGFICNVETKQPVEFSIYIRVGVYDCDHGGISNVKATLLFWRLVHCGRLTLPLQCEHHYLLCCHPCCQLPLPSQLDKASIPWRLWMAKNVFLSLSSVWMSLKNSQCKWITSDTNLSNV